MTPLAASGLRAGRHGRVRVVFAGRPFAPRHCDPVTALATVPTASRPLAEVVWNRQIHSDRVVAAEVGTTQEADALWTTREDIGLAVMTADCLPVLLSGQRSLAAVHAGWRGLAAAVIRRALEQVGEAPGELTAWIGPAIGACCYQVGNDVAARVALTSGPDVIVPRERRPHLDLVGAALLQLEACGVADIRLLTRCTGCHPSSWWSHRRGAEPGARNLAFIWRAPEA